MALSGSGRRARRHGGGVGAKTVPQMLTPVPFCRSLIDETLLSEEETRWMDRHHDWCHAVLLEEFSRTTEDEVKRVGWDDLKTCRKKMARGGRPATQLRTCIKDI